MASRRKKADGPPDDNGTDIAETPAPAVTFAADSDRVTRIEVSVWERRVEVEGDGGYTQHTLTVSRSVRDTGGTLRATDSFRVHDAPVLLYLLRQAHDWCLARRTTISDGSDALSPS